MNIAFLNLCHCDPQLVARVTGKLTAHPNLDVYLHIDGKSEIAPFQTALADCPRVYFTANRKDVYWGGFAAIEATIELLRAALASPRQYDYFVTLQNLDYPIRANADLLAFFEKSAGTEFIRGCNIARARDWHYARKYRIYNQRDNAFYLRPHSRARMYLRYLRLRVQSVSTILFNGVIREGGQSLDMHYGTAQWAVTRACAEYLVRFYETHPKFNARMAHVQFPDEEYFHTVVHNSPFKYHCVKYDEPTQRWLVNWRNLHYFEYPREVTVLTENDFDKIMAQDVLFIRKVRTGVSDTLLDRIDAATSASKGDS